MAWSGSAQFALALLNGTGYFVLGLLIFRQAEREAKRRGYSADIDSM